MEAQSYKNHIRYYTPHHFVYYPVLLILLVISIYFSFASDDTIIWIFISLIFVILFGLGFMLRQHYALTLQNRIVKLELRYRYLSLTGKRLELIEEQLSDEQIFALRFSPDSELIVLIEKALDENLSGNSIKKSITNWKGDYERV
ncbi:DUF6526 family protein [Flavobacterium sp. PL02]|jgi:hypothetical protein|uniref:DUF6526 family protein n=1 Tax=Flavobacterium sp. PL02 TaxID=3088354 RepID=UPI002B23E322|nr:DUF6526 family protein [Flavobacterium sp. PL02]MEA9415418.1 DUF6526 family protein [Flavobacterium sp. PL02]